MRSSLRPYLLALAAALTGCDALLPPTCVRNSDCPSGQLCGATGVCVLPPDAAPADADGDAGSGATDAATTDAAAVRS